MRNYYQHSSYYLFVLPGSSMHVQLDEKKLCSNTLHHYKSCTFAVWKTFHITVNATLVNTAKKKCLALVPLQLIFRLSNVAILPRTPKMC